MNGKHINQVKRLSFYLVLLGGFISCSEKRVPATHVIEMQQMQFQPGELTLQKGDTVVFINNDIVVHNVTEAAKAMWSSSELPAGQSWKTVIDRSCDYICTIHPTMKGKLIVK